MVPSSGDISREVPQKRSEQCHHQDSSSDVKASTSSFAGSSRLIYMDKQHGKIEGELLQ